MLDLPPDMPKNIREQLEDDLLMFGNYYYEKREGEYVRIHPAELADKGDGM